MDKANKISRKDQILQALARMLEAAPGQRITTAALAREVGVSEAALYRHFPSKARMFEGLIKFIEDTLFARITRIINEEDSAEIRCHNILLLLLTFCDKNPGMTRLLTGDALAGETERLRERIAQFFGRLEAQLKQVLREAQIRENLKTTISPTILTNLLLASVEGRLVQFVRSEFKVSPLDNWDTQWDFLSKNLLEPYSATAEIETTV
ncbi:nucleoid occlusion factor SlmA [Gammaproteobacteria bacterium]|jgi:TetR/AcrR family transcriptional regulator|nr:nucleoid occlusion factor SlmA [Gammaproteobacteria bacterium]MDB9968314.1 nucleoid occlusion factor SlmA [Gammaproteobacteria bacterium]